MARLEEVDDAIAAHLYTLFGSRRYVTAGEYRTAIVAWCSSAEARAQYDAEVLAGTACALETMEDSLFMPLVRNLLARSPARRHAGIV